MLTLNRDNYLLPFPPIPPDLSSRFAVENLALRPFGRSPADKDIDFQHTPRPYLEAEIVEVCTQSHGGTPPDRQFFWNLEVGKRTECLLTLATWGGAWDLDVELNCRSEDCQAEMELEFSLEELSRFQRQVELQGQVTLSLGDQVFALRRPTGLDQLTWLGQLFPDETSAMQTMIQTLLSPEQWDAFQQAWETEETPLATLNQAMAQQDPLVNLSLKVSCPACAALDVHTVDVGALALQRLREAQDHLLETVHRLASHYHWTEPAIFALPTWRRDRYLELIERSQQ
jgi:hypothetical protein